MTSCQCNYVTGCGSVKGKCKDFCRKGCWSNYHLWKPHKGGDCQSNCKMTPNQWYVRRTNTHYNSILDTGPLGHPKANGFGPVMFEKNIPVWLWLDNAVKHGKGPKHCRYRCKGHGRLKGPTPATCTTPGGATTSRSVAPAFQSYETVLAIRKAKAYFDPKNYKRHKRWHRANSRY